MRLAAFIMMLLLLAAGAASAKPTPEPGGANQAKAVAGVFGKPAFNGVVRLTPRELRFEMRRVRHQHGFELGDRAVVIACAEVEHGVIILLLKRRHERSVARQCSCASGRIFMAGKNFTNRFVP